MIIWTIWLIHIFEGVRIGFFWVVSIFYKEEKYQDSLSPVVGIVAINKNKAIINRRYRRTTHKSSTVTAV